MTRPHTRIALCIVLGTVTSTVIAWSIAIAVPIDRGNPIDPRADFRLTRGDDTWPAIAPDDCPPLMTTAGVAAPGVSWRQWGSQAAPQNHILTIWRYGWPFACAEAHVTFMIDLAATPTQTPSVFHRCIGPVTIFSQHDRHLPTAPVWPGLLANTLIYASAWWLLLFAPGVIIRWRRRRAGRCTKCGYDVRGSTSAACPECGRER